jgi:7-carboxy-7-deazaguanine synthase
MKLKVFETFTSIQGESSHAGKICFFIRLAGCNLNCSYCDTQYAKNPASGTEMSICNLVSLAKKAGAPIVEITGGEPLLQHQVPMLCEQLQEAGLIVMVETNGTQPVDILPPGTIRIIDCKCPSSGESERMLLSNCECLKPFDEMKFVISDENDFLYALAKIKKFGILKKTRNILFSPVFGKFPAAKLAELMIKHKSPGRLQLQIHKYIWDPATRGV